MADETTPRQRAVHALAANEQTGMQEQDNCGPEPERPDYFSPQSVRDRYYQWKLCKSDA